MIQFAALRTFLTVPRRTIHLSSRRCMLNPSYYCKEVWAGRLQQDVIQKIDVDNFTAKVFEKMEVQGVVSSVDMDLIANKVELASDKMKDFMIEVYERFRKYPDAANTLDSTPYALVRNVLEEKKYDQLIELCQKKIKYGVFLDEHMANMALDQFLKENDFQRAAVIAYDIMLQETIEEHPLTAALMWKACHFHWKTANHAPAAPYEEDPNDEDIRYIKVDYVSTPYYDDHFDIPHDVWKLGKTFVALTEGKDDVKHLSYRLIGWALYDKYDKAFELLQSVLDNADHAIAAEAMKTLWTRLEGVITKEPAQEEKPIGLQTVADYYPVITQQQKEQYIEKLQDLTPKLNGANKVQEFDLEQSVEKDVREKIAAHESESMKLHEAQLKRWQEERLEKVQKEIENIKLIMRKKALGDRLRELHLKEEKLKFFEDPQRAVRSITRLKRRVRDKYPRHIVKSGQWW